MIDPEDYLKEFGLQEKEAKVYIAALQLGTFKISQIATLSGLKRPTCYLLIDSLLKQGLVSVVPKSKKLSYQAESPSKLIELAERKLSTARHVIPTLNMLNSQNKDSPIIKFYSGQEGIRNIYDDTLNISEQEYRYFGSSRDLIDAAGEDYLKEYIHRRIKKGKTAIGIRVRDTEVNEPIYLSGKKYLRDVRFAPKGLRIPSMIMIYGKKVAVISTKKGNFGFLIESEEFYETMLNLFNTVWNISDIT